jgi:tetratricopeptide (TPR) repeat protein
VAYNELRTASALDNLGDLSEAKAALEDAIATARELGSMRNLITGEQLLGWVLTDKGELDRALSLYDDALRYHEEQGKSTLMPAVLRLFTASVIERRGELVEALRRTRESVEKMREVKATYMVAVALQMQGWMEMVSGDLAAAQKSHAEALQIRTQMAISALVAESRLGLAQVAVEDGRADEAAELARLALTELAREKERDNMALAQAALARALMASGDKRAMQDALGQARQLARSSENPRVRLLVATTDATLRAQIGNAAELGDAAASLATAVDDATRAGYLGEALAARLALGALELRIPERAAAGREHLRALAADAKARGYGLVASRAAALTP